MQFNEEKLDNLLLQLGFDDFILGGKYLRRAVRDYDPTFKMTDFYAYIGKQFDSTGARVERAIRHAKQKAILRGDPHEWARVFGWTFDPDTGDITNSELIARLARVCHED